MTAKIGFVGLGRMGLGMASNMVRKGLTTSGYDLNPEAIDNFADNGGTRGQSIADCVRGASHVFTMLPNSEHVRDVVLNEIIPAAAPGTIIVDMSTIDPMATAEISEEVIAAGLRFADAPVGRLAMHADRGECLFMVGADDDVFHDIKPMLEAMGTTIHHCGGIGTGIRTKLINNFLAITIAQVNAEALTLAKKFELDIEKTIDIVNGTTATNGHLVTNFPSKVLADDIDPGFQIDLAYKDIGLALGSASALHVPMSVGASARECMQLARARGFGRNDFSALLDSWCGLADVEKIRL